MAGNFGLAENGSATINSGDAEATGNATTTNVTQEVETDGPGPRPSARTPTSPGDAKAAGTDGDVRHPPGRQRGKEQRNVPQAIRNNVNDKENK